MSTEVPFTHERINRMFYNSVTD